MKTLVNKVKSRPWRQSFPQLVQKFNPCAPIMGGQLDAALPTSATSHDKLIGDYSMGTVRETVSGLIGASRSATSCPSLNDHWKAGFQILHLAEAAS